MKCKVTCTLIIEPFPTLEVPRTRQLLDTHRSILSVETADSINHGQMVKTDQAEF